MKGSDLLVRALENEGVERIFGVPGEENLDVVESLRHSRIQLVLAGKLGSRTVGKDGVVVLGPPTVFNADNIDKFNF